MYSETAGSPQLPSPPPRILFACYNDFKCTFWNTLKGKRVAGIVRSRTSALHRHVNP
ncbi:hypothetical protein PtB15_9B677 [Puccinia triticina]|nr:hypothetical protein PtB15_9B677 [Puccinia triticina]